MSSCKRLSGGLEGVVERSEVEVGWMFMSVCVRGVETV